MLSDSHCHLDQLNLTKYQGSLVAALANARLQGVDYILAPATNLQSSQVVSELALNYTNVVAAVGVHPSETVDQLVNLAKLSELATASQVVAIGETGLDLWPAMAATEILRQQQLFKLHIEVAKLLNKPLIIHSRNADQQVVDILTTSDAKRVGGVLHCFTGSWAMAEAVLALGFYISLSGIITFKNADALRAILQRLPLNRLLIETDAPYLAPVPVRGQPNEPAFLLHIAEFIAQQRRLSYMNFVAQTTENFCQLFQI